MDQMSRQTEIRDTEPKGNNARRIIGVIFGVIEIILAMRFIFKLLGANPDNGFVRFIYNITQFFVGIFEGIFANVNIGASGNAVFEPATLIAIVLVALVGWLLSLLIVPRVSSRVERTEYVRPVVPDNQPYQNNAPQYQNNIPQNPNNVPLNQGSNQPYQSNAPQNPNNIPLNQENRPPYQDNTTLNQDNNSLNQDNAQYQDNRQRTTDNRQPYQEDNQQTDEFPVDRT